MHGHGKKVSILQSGQELKALPSDINLFRSIRQIVPNPEETGLPWRMLEDLDTSMDFLLSGVSR